MNETMKETSAVCVPTTLNWDSSICEAAQSSLTSAYFLFRCITGGGSACELSSIANNTVSEFKTFLSLLDSSPSHNRRIRKGPLPNSMEVDLTELLGCRDLPDDVICSSSQAGPKHKFYSKTLPSTQSILYSNSVDVRSISKQILSFYHAPSIQRSMEDSSVLSSKRKNEGGEAGTGYTASTGECHCSKRRRLRIKRTIRVPAVGSKLAEIPSDDFTWRKCGQKPIKGSPYPRSYYKCSSMRGCPARKHVERCTDDVNMLIVTYEGDHDHPGLTLAVSSTTTIPH